MTREEALVIVMISLKVALSATAITAIPGILVGRVLAGRRFFGKTVLRTIVSAPMVLPPVAIGLLLLHVLRGDGAVAAAARTLGIGPLVLTWKAATIAAATMSFPLVVFGAQQGFESVPPRLVQLARTFGASRRDVFLRVTLPLARRSILYGLVFAFARALGEFGATTLVAGNIPGETQTLAIAIYDRIHDFKDGEAWALAGIAAALSFASIGVAETFFRRSER